MKGGESPPPIKFNPILNGGRGGGKFTLSAIYRLKSPESGNKGGVKWYQYSSWDIWGTAKEFSGPKNFFCLTPGPAKFARRKKGVSQNLNFLTFDQNWSPKMIKGAQFWATIT